MDELLEVMKALSDGSRLRTLMALRSGELCACQLTELLRLAPSTVSRHMAVLRHAGLVTSRREGRWIHYGLVQDSRSPCVEALLKTVFEQLSKDAAFSDERIRIEAIRMSMTCGPDGDCGSC